MKARLAMRERERELSGGLKYHASCLLWNSRLEFAVFSAFKMNLGG